MKLVVISLWLSLLLFCVLRRITLYLLLKNTRFFSRKMKNPKSSKVGKSKAKKSPPKQQPVRFTVLEYMIVEWQVPYQDAPRFEVVESVVSISLIYLICRVLMNTQIPIVSRKFIRGKGCLNFYFQKYRTVWFAKNEEDTYTNSIPEVIPRPKRVLLNEAP